MFSRTKRDADGERLDEVGDDLVRAARATEEEIGAAAASTLLYASIRASIAARQRESESPMAGWVVFFRAARLAVPAMALLTVVVTCLPRLVANSKFHAPARRAAKSAPYATPEFAYDGDSVTPRSQGPTSAPSVLTFATGTCALSNTQECAISSNEVLATLFADDNQETQR